MLKLYVHGDRESSALHSEVYPFIEDHLGLNVTIVRSLDLSDLAIAPLLRRKLSKDEYSAPRLGTLIFHPSLLPRHRGPDALKQAIAAGEKYSGVTWFWCDEGLDTGPLCEQEVINLPPDLTPRQIYNQEVIPAAMSTLARALKGIYRDGIVRRIPQNESAATYESYLKPLTNAIA